MLLLVNFVLNHCILWVHLAPQWDVVREGSQLGIERGRLPTLDEAICRLSFRGAISMSLICLFIFSALFLARLQNPVILTDLLSEDATSVIAACIFPHIRNCYVSIQLAITSDAPVYRSCWSDTSLPDRSTRILHIRASWTVNYKLPWSF